MGCSVATENRDWDIAKHWALVTVPHTGTRFVLERLTPHFSTVSLPLTMPPNSYLYPILYQHHCNAPSMLPYFDARRAQGVGIITTDRAHADVAASWQRRYGNARRLSSAWDIWTTYVKPVADVIITLDGTEDAQLDAFEAEHLGQFAPLPEPNE